MSKEDAVNIYTDGACSGNPGPGGWGVVMRWKGQEKEMSGFEAATTNNRMELMAVIHALESLKRGVGLVNVHTDSKYVMDGATKWMHGWKRNGWKTGAKKAVKNQDLWQQLDGSLKEHTIEWFWVKGHSGHPENDRCDELARMAIQDMKNSRVM